MTTCPLCARPRSAADPRGLAWSSEHRPDGTVSWICPDCTRRALPDIEALLPLRRAEIPAARLRTAA